MKICLIFLLFFIWSFTAFAFSRDEIIARQMDCVAQQKQGQTIGWNDICFTGGDEEGRSQAVNAQLDAVENSQDAQKASPVSPLENNKTADSLSYKNYTEIPFGIRQHLNPRHTHTFDMGTEPYFYAYKEPDASVTISGMMMGYYANYAYRPPDGNLLNNTVLNTYMLEGRFASGDLDYKGSGIVKDKDNVNFEIRGLLGKDYLLGDSSLITPYLGFGYRYLLDKGNGRLSSTDAYGYDRYSHYYYLPIGLNGSIPNGKWSCAINLEYDILIQGIQKSDLSDGNQFTGYNNPNVRNDQGSGFGVRGSFKLTYTGVKFNFYVEPFIRFWNIGRSNLASATIDGVYYDQLNEPKNNTTEIGSKFGIMF